MTHAPCAEDDLPPDGANAAAVCALHADMLRFARLQLRDETLAEDAVQEAIEAALTALKRFSGDASLKTWVFSILRHKIVDLIRRSQKTVAMSALAPDIDHHDEAIERLFQQDGHWQPDARPVSWVQPDHACENQQFWRVFEACLDRLPENVGRVFMMREMLGLDTGEICAELSISANNCHVILHRARVGLRHCLEGNWFNPQPGHAC